MGRRPSTLPTKPSFVKVLFQDFSHKLLIPPKFVKRHGEVLGKRCFLQPTSDEQTPWRVKTKTINNRLYFKKGWKKFVKHQQLQFGDLLVFRCVDDSVFDVDIYDKTCCFKEVTITSSHNVKNTATVMPSNRKMKKANLTEAIEEAETFMSQSQFPCFKMVMQSVYVKTGSYLHIPLDFATEHDMIGRELHVKFVVEDEVWNIKLIKTGRFTTNWTDFVRDNGLQLKDVCVFELTNTEDYTFRVEIFKHDKGEEKEISSMQEDKSESPSPRVSPKTKERNSKALEAAKQFLSNSKHPSCATSIRPSYLRNGCLHVTSTFVRETHTQPGSYLVKLEFLGKKYRAVFHNKGKSSRINKGWRNLVEENSVELGDACALELINREDGVIRVSIFKSTN